ncbi:hypothetical protein B0H16DRAFT_1690701 [Mycena metata]|uniref:Uncharacterized protein n=1 Tax=Mycena metata TaxID=1033252 RepID=A0AAD7NBG1_9AGAR|nr:hypothetical protein B0H16DRAFT_1690701 [Mycena metata]
MASQTPPSSQLVSIASQPRVLNARGDLVTTRLLESVGVTINTELNLYICLPCGSAHTHSIDFSCGILNHLQHEHSGATSSIRDHIVEYTHGFPIMEKYPSIESTTVARLAFSGVHITQDQFGCLHCPYAASEKVVQRYMRETHLDRKGKASSGLSTQVLNSGTSNATTRIRVAERLDVDDEPPSPMSSPLAPLTPTQSSAFGPSSPSPPSSQPRTPRPAKTLMDLFSEFDPKDYQAEELPNAHMITPWLLRNGWHKHLEPYRDDDAQLIQLASVLSDEEFPALHKAVASYFTVATNLIEHTNEVVLQRLNSADPVKNFTLARARALLDAGHRAVEECTAHCSQLHRILLSLWMAKWEATQHHTIHDPTMCFLALLSLEPSGEFAGPKKTTGPSSFGQRLIVSGVVLKNLREGHLGLV